MFLIFIHNMSSAVSDNKRITITRALVELKLLDSRIRKTIDEGEYIRMTNRHKRVDEQLFNRNAQSSYQSIRDLIERRNKIKSAIVVSNALTHVRIRGKDYSVAEAIERKNSIEYDKAFLQKMKENRTHVQMEFERYTSDVQKKLDRLLEIEFGKDVKSNSDNVTSITNSYMENNQGRLVDPIRLSEKIAELEQEIEDFESEVNFVLSESNSLTTISID